jgi:hypothetical protein
MTTGILAGSLFVSVIINIVQWFFGKANRDELEELRERNGELEELEFRIQDAARSTVKRKEDI